jgi:hypothetical protein
MTGRDRGKGAFEKMKGARRRWLSFIGIEPGHRFQARYYQRRRLRERGEVPEHGRVLNLAAGFSLLITGFLLAWIAVAAGLWLIAGEFLPLARLFDRAEVSLRKLFRLLEHLWTNASPAARLLVVIATLACIAALAYAAYYLFFG